MSGWEWEDITRQVPTRRETIMQRYSDEHYQTVADMYREENGKVSKVQDHYPTYSIRTIQRWVKRCREMGLIK